MKKFLAFTVICLLCAVGLWAQAPPSAPAVPGYTTLSFDGQYIYYNDNFGVYHRIAVTPIQYPSDPTGVCIGTQTAINVSNNGLFYCFAGSWTKVSNNNASPYNYTAVPCASTMAFALTSTGKLSINNAFSVNLNCNVLSSSVTFSAGTIAAGTQIEFAITQGSGGGYAFAWPSNFLNPPSIQTGSLQETDAAFWYDGTNWHRQDFPSSGGGSSYYQTIQNNNVDLPQRAKLNCVPPLNCSDDSGNSRTAVVCPIFISAGASHAAGCVPDPGATLHNPLYYLDETGTFSGIPGVTNAAIKPDISSAVAYVAQRCIGGVSCSDSNDGLSWGTAKYTIYNAACSLPGGNCSSQLAGSGTIYVGPYVSSSWNSANPTSGDGVWIMGSGDPNYASPPTGWLKESNVGTPTTLNIIGVGNYPSGPNGHKGGRVLALWGSNGDNYHPGVWLSAASGIYIANFGIQYPGRAVLIGECSDHTRTGTCQSTTDMLDNVSGQLGLSTGGPCTDITGASFWIWMRDYGCSGLGAGGSGGYLADKSSAILVDGTSNYGPGLIYIWQSNLSTGGIKVNSGTNGTSVYVKDTLQEGNGTACPPVVWFTGFGTDSDATVENVYTADCSLTLSSRTVQNDDTVSGRGPTVLNSHGQMAGPGTMINPELSPGAVTTTSPLASQQNGIFHSYLIGQTNVARRLNGFSSVRATNQVNSSSSGWGAAQSSSGVTVTTGVIDPYGGTGAGSVVISSGTQTLSFTGSTYTHWTGSLGDWVVGGVWVKNFNTNAGLAISACPSESSVAYSSTVSNHGGELLNNASGIVDSWEFVWVAGKVGTSGTYACLTQTIGTGVTPIFYGPVLYFIPQTVMTDNEVIEFATTMNSAGYFMLSRFHM